jgi:nucleotide-binding universal stress UspA family protein
MSSRRRIVCGTELREGDRTLADEAARLSRALSAELILVHAGAPPPSGAADVPESVRVAARGLERRVSAELEREGDALTREAVRLRQPDLAVRAVQAAGRPHEVLVEVADATDDSLLVVGTRSKRPLGRTIDHVVRHARSPVVAIPDGAPPLARGLTVAVAFDASETAAHALALSAEVAGRLGGTLAIIHACGPAEAHDARARIEAMLREREPDLARSASVFVVPIETTVADAVVAQAARCGAQLLALGSHARRGLARAILGSTPEAVLHRATTAVLLVR